MSETNYNNVYKSRKRMLADNFLGGFAWSFGTIIGGAIIILAITFAVRNIDVVPIMGGFVRDVMQEALKVPTKQSPIQGVSIP